MKSVSERGVLVFFDQFFRPFLKWIRGSRRDKTQVSKEGGLSRRDAISKGLPSSEFSIKMSGCKYCFSSKEEFRSEICGLRKKQVLGLGRYQLSQRLEF